MLGLKRATRAGHHLVLKIARWAKARPHVRPWALAAPVLVLLITLPLLRPLRHPGSWSISADESARLATISAIVDRHSLAIDPTSAAARDPFVSRRLLRFQNRLYSDQPPMLALILSLPYWLLVRMGWSIARAPALAPYLLTLVGSALPAAAAASMVYKMARVFELRRPWRTLLAILVTATSGLLSYSTVLCACVPTGVLVLASAGSLLYVAASKRTGGKFAWFALAGALGALAGAIDLAGSIFFVLLAVVVWFFPWSRGRRISCLALYLSAAVPILLIYLWLNVHVTGSLKPATFHPELALTNSANPEDAEDTPTTFLQSLLAAANFELSPMLGRHGVLTHFPAIVFALIGAFAVIHRNWPITTKVLAMATLVGSAGIFLSISPATTEPTRIGFAYPRFVIATPLLLFWTGAFLRRSHRKATWIAAQSAFGITAIIGLIGATGPMPRDGYDGYSAVVAARRIIWSSQTPGTDPLIQETP